MTGSGFDYAASCQIDAAMTKKVTNVQFEIRIADASQLWNGMHGAASLRVDHFGFATVDVFC